MRGSYLATSTAALALASACGLLDSTPDLALEANVISAPGADTVAVAYTVTNVSDHIVRLGVCCHHTALVRQEELGDSRWQCQIPGPCLAFCPERALAPGEVITAQHEQLWPPVGRCRLGIGYSREDTEEVCWAWSAPIRIE